MHTNTLVFLALCAFLPLASSVTVAEKFFGVFDFINQTIFPPNGAPVYYYLNGPRGGIFYVPAYPGASYGNMTALWGDIFPSGANASRDEVGQHSSGYGGPYILNAENGIITHYPAYGTVPTLIGVPQERHYFFYENDNLLNLQVIYPNGYVYGTLWWRRVHPLPGSPSCSVSLAISTDSSWVSEDQHHERQSVTVTNNGPNAAISVVLNVALYGLTIESTSQVSPVAGQANQFTAPLYGLASGSSYSAAQFQFVGSGSATISVVSVNC